MPIYEYQCLTCGNVHELWRSAYESGECECPRCSTPMHKLISRISFQLKGGGWYADGYCTGSKEKDSGIKPADATSCSGVGNDESKMCSACSGR